MSDTKNIAKVVFRATLLAIIKKKKKVYISSCPVLDVVSQGKTEEEARWNLIEATRLFLISCYERGTLDKTLKEGMQIVGTTVFNLHLS